MGYRWESDKKVSGLAVRITPTGGRSFHFRYGLRGKWDRSMKLGDVTELTLKAARQRANELRLLVAQGIDPGARRQELRHAPVMAQLQERYIEEWAKRRKRSWKNDDGYWRNHIMRAPFAKLRVCDVTPGAVSSWHSSHPKPITANRALESLSKAFALAKRWGWVDANPCDGIEAHPEKSRRRYATESELAAILAELSRMKTTGGFEFRFACLIELLLLTGARLREIMLAKWDDIDFDRGVLIPQTHKTEDVSHREIVLGDAALDVIRQLRTHEIPGEHLIRGKGPGPLSGYRRPWLRVLKAAEVADLRVHDVRHTFASYLLSSGQTLGVIGELLGHQSAQTTSRYAHLIDQRRKQAVDASAEILLQAGSNDPHTSGISASLPRRSLHSSAKGTESPLPCNVLRFPRDR